MLNNENGANGAGHNAVLLINSARQGFIFSFFPDGNPLNGPGQMRTKFMSPSEVHKLIYDSPGGTVNNLSARTTGGVTGATLIEDYNRFVDIKITSESGTQMYNKGMELYNSPPTYKLLANNCADVTRQIFAAGGMKTDTTIRPNDYYLNARKLGIYWQITNN